MPYNLSLCHLTMYTLSPIITSKHCYQELFTYLPSCITTMLCVFEYIFPARNSAQLRTKFFASGWNVAWFNLGLGQRSWLPQFYSVEIFFACFLKELVVFRIFVRYWVFCSSLFLQIWLKINLRTTLCCRHLRTLQLVTSHSFQTTTLRSHLPPNHTYNPIPGPYHLSIKTSHQTSHPHATLTSRDHGSITEIQVQQPALVTIPAW